MKDCKDRIMCKAGQQEWLSLFTTEVESLWNTEPTDIRMIIIIHHILQKEFKRIETNINEKIETFKHKVKLASSLEESGFKDSSQSSSTIINTENLELLEQSPKIKRFRKVHRKKVVNNPQLLNNLEDSLNCYSFSLLNPKKLSDKPLDDDCVIVSDIVKENVIISEPDVNDVIDSSILNNTADLSSKNKKFKVTKSKKTNRSANKSNKNNCTLTQLLNNKTWSSNAEKIDITDNKTIKDDGSKINTLPKPLQKSYLFQNYDRVPVKKSVVPEYPHKMETVRCKADKLKLPGWSCKECQDYYEDFNLNEEQLRKKMNACSKHRNKFNPFNDTPKGYWDVTMFSSQED